MFDFFLIWFIYSFLYSSSTILFFYYFNRNSEHSSSTHNRTRTRTRTQKVYKKKSNNNNEVNIYEQRLIKLLNKVQNGAETKTVIDDRLKKKRAVFMNHKIHSIAVNNHNSIGLISFVRWEFLYGCSRFVTSCYLLNSGYLTKLEICLNDDENADSFC